MKTTVNLSYKDVFRLAESKGYKMFYWYSLFDAPKGQKINENGALIEITMLQKWLRIEHKIGGSKLKGFVPKQQMREFLYNEDYKII